MRRSRGFKVLKQGPRGPSWTHLHHQTLLLLRAVPPQFGQLVDLRVQKLVLSLIRLDIVLKTQTF